MSALVQLDAGRLFGGDFRVVEPLKHGGMGSVYVVEQLQTGAKRALKLMHPQLVQDPKFRKRFEQEARIGAQIPSEHVVQVIAAGVDAATGTAWLVMELLEGEDLDTCLRRRGQLPQAEAIEVLGQLCHALGAAHSVGIVHRDLKPANIFLAVARRRGVPFTVKVLDFGIAKIVAESSTNATEAVGSPMWMAPEQTTQDHEILPATDVWALGLLTFRLLTGRYYWKAPNKPGATTAMLFREILIEALPSAAQRAAEHGVAGLPKGFDTWFSHCVAREPEARYHNAAEAFTALEKILAAPRPGSSPNMDMLGWKETKDPNKPKRRDEEVVQRGNQRQAMQPETPSRKTQPPLAPVEMPPAREKTPPKHAPSLPKQAPEKRADAPEQVSFEDLDEPIQRVSRPPPPPMPASPPPPPVEPEPPSQSSTTGEVTEDIYSGPDTVPAHKAMLDKQEAAEKQAAWEAAKIKATEAREAAVAKKAAEAEAAKQRQAEAEAARQRQAEAEAAKPKTPEPRAVEPKPAAKPKPEAEPERAPAQRTATISSQSPPQRTLAPVVDAGTLSKVTIPKPASSSTGSAPRSSAVSKPPPSVAESSKLSSGSKSGPESSVAAASAQAGASPKSSQVTPDTDLRGVETVSGVANTSPDMMLSPRSAPRKLTRIGAMSAAAGVALLIAVFGIRSYQKGQLERVCTTEVQDEATVKRTEACGELCKAGSAAHCVTQGDLLLQTAGGATPDRTAAAAAYQSACTLGWDQGCTKAAQVLTSTSATPTGTGSPVPTAPASGVPIDIDLEAEMSPAKHVVVMYARSQGAPATIARSKEQARARALEALNKLKSGAKFEDIMREYSDDDASKARGGAPDMMTLGKLASGVERLKTGDVDVIETSIGFHVVLRTQNPMPSGMSGDPSLQAPRGGDKPPTGTDTPPSTGAGQPSIPTATTPATTPTTPATTPTTTPTEAPATTAAAGPPDEAAMRRALEPKVMSGNASLQEMKLLRAICGHMGDQQCKARVNALIQQKEQAPP